jgi:hypothetical protein
LFVASTIILMGLALAVALAPIAIRYFDRQTVTHIAVVSDDDRLATIFFMGYFFPPILPALPALRRTFSPAYRTPLPL